MKIGVAKNCARRLSRLTKETPFSFSLIEKVFYSKGAALEAEKKALMFWQSAGLSGFSGATEWLRSDPDLVRYVSSLSSMASGRYG